MQVQLPPKNQFWSRLSEYGKRPALIEAETGRILDYNNLAAEVRKYTELLSTSTKSLIMLNMERTVSSVAAYLGALNSGNAVILYSPNSSNEILINMISAYRPDTILGSAATLAGPNDGYELVLGKVDKFARCRASPSQIFQDLGMILSTSGTGGMPKGVKISFSNISSAASQVATAQKLDGYGRLITSVPIHHVFGLSILNAQLSVGGSVLLCSRSIVDRDFWNTVGDFKPSLFLGVPWTYNTLFEVNFEPENYSSLCGYAVSGGRLNQSVYQWLRTRFSSKQIYSMYGQTEACGRMSVLPPELFSEKTMSVGKPVQGGKIRFTHDEEIIFEGPNVMLGYATNQKDLLAGDEMRGSLPTRDFGYIDAEGYLYITGRRDRVIKIYGNRIDLGGIQNWFQSMNFEVAVEDCSEKKIMVFCDEKNLNCVESLLPKLASALELPRSIFVIEGRKYLLRTETGKLKRQST